MGDKTYTAEVLSFTKEAAFRCPFCKKALAKGRFVVRFAVEEYDHETSYLFLGTKSAVCCGNNIPVITFFNSEDDANAKRHAICDLIDRNKPEALGEDTFIEVDGEITTFRLSELN